MSRGRLFVVAVVACVLTAAVALGARVDAAPVAGSISVNDAAADEGSQSNPGTVVFTVTVTGVTSGESVHYATENGTAVAGVDYVATSGDLTFSGPGSRTVSVPVIGESTSEPDETFVLKLTGNTFSDDSGTGTIRNDDWRLSIGDTSITEGDSGSKNAALQISLSPPRPAATTVQYQTANGTATAGQDYTDTSGTATIPANAQSTTVNVPILGDTLYEDNETFTVSLSSPTSPVMIDDGSATGTIVNDDAEPPPGELPVLSIDNASTTETDDGTHTAVFNVHLSAATSRTVAVTATTSDATAKAPADYAAKTSTVVFNPAAGPQTKSFSVSVNGDELDESDETFNATLSSPSAATINDASKTAAMTIVDDDPAPKLTVADAAATEGAKVRFTLTLAFASGRDLVVGVSTTDGTATAPNDYTAVNAATVTIPAGATTAVFEVQTAADSADEPAEAFTLKAKLDGLTDEATGTINNGAAPATGSEYITTGAGAGAGSHVRVFAANGAAQAPEGFFPYGDGPGVRVARGDLDADGHDEIVVAAGRGAPSIVQVFTPTGSALIDEVDAYPGFGGGVYVSVGDVDGDGRGDVITSAGAGGGPHVRTFKLIGTPGNRSLQGSSGFFGAPAEFRGGLTVAAGDVNGDDTDEIVLGTATADQPVVYVWNYNPTTNAPSQYSNPFLAYTPQFLGGITVAAGDLDGDGKAEIVTGAGPGGGPHVRVFTGSGGGLPGSAYAYDAGFTGGVLVAAGDLDGDGKSEIITAAGPGGGPHVRSFNVAMQPGTTSFYAYGPNFGGGVFVAAGRP